MSDNAAGDPFADATPPQAVGAMEIALLAIDIDGTLVAHGDSVTPETCAAVRRANAAGLHIVLATGRRYRTTQVAIEALELPLPAVCLGGALTKDGNGETLYDERFQPEQLAVLLRLARSHRLPLLLQRDAYANGGPDFVADGGTPWNVEMRTYMKANGNVGHVEATPEASGHSDVLMIGCFATRAPLAALQAAIAKHHGDTFATVLVESKKTPGWYLETTLKHVNKWYALRRLAADAGIAADAVCAVGDSLNDLPMIRGAGFGVAMGNAEPTVQAAADWITGSNRDDGLVPLIDRLLASQPGQTRKHQRG